jgi:hypothetical protein
VARVEFVLLLLKCCNTVSCGAREGARRNKQATEQEEEDRGYHLQGGPNQAGNAIEVGGESLCVLAQVHAATWDFLSAWCFAEKSVRG